LIGGKKLFELYQQGDLVEAISAQPHTGTNGRFVTVALVTLANGGDNIGIYTPAFAAHSAPEISVIAGVFLGMTALWCLAAHAIANHPKLRSPLQWYAHRFTPVILISLGVVILYQAGSFGLLFNFAATDH
jgi:cadmium resistance protein CadD (predicted permease)